MSDNQRQKQKKNSSRVSAKQRAMNGSIQRNYYKPKVKEVEENQLTLL